MGKKIGILIGMNIPELLKPLNVVSTTTSGPYASQHYSGWALNGPYGRSLSNRAKCFRTSIQDITELDRKIEQCFAQDFVDEVGRAPSRDDLLWTEKVSSSINKKNGRNYEVALPFKRSDIAMPNNYGQVCHHIYRLKTQLMKNIVT